MNEEIKKILGENIIIDKEIFPIEHLRYTGDSKKYIVWSMLDEYPAFFGNDEIIYNEYSVDIDIYSDGNIVKILKYIKSIMKNNDWIWTGDSAEMYEEDTKLNHRTCSFVKEGVNEEWQG